MPSKNKWFNCFKGCSKNVIPAPACTGINSSGNP
jgi:hypothetical protein